MKNQNTLCPLEFAIAVAKMLEKEGFPTKECELKIPMNPGMETSFTPEMAAALAAQIAKKAAVEPEKASCAGESHKCSGQCQCKKAAPAASSAPEKIVIHGKKPEYVSELESELNKLTEIIRLTNRVCKIVDDQDEISYEAFAHMVDLQSMMSASFTKIDCLVDLISDYYPEFMDSTAVSYTHLTLPTILLV